MGSVVIEYVLCDCRDCREADEPCTQDCDLDEACAGCHEAHQEAADREFDEMSALSYLRRPA